MSSYCVSWRSSTLPANTISFDSAARPHRQCPKGTREQASKSGAAKLLRHCTLPLTGTHCVNAVLTNKGWFDVVGEGHDAHLVLKEIAPGETVESLREATEAHFEVAEDLVTIDV